MPGAYSNLLLPLDPNSRWIRVFDLQPASPGHEEEPIQGQLRVVCLDHRPSYSALSYAWGNYLTPFKIVCKTSEGFSVTQNCYEALQHLRHAFRTRTLWVDSICIDQTNDEEKSHQVSLMRDIYIQAGRVYIWLGPGTQQSDYAMDWLSRATIDIPPQTAVRIAPFPEFFRFRDLARLLRMAALSTRAAVYPRKPERLQSTYNSEAMKDLINREWFERVWTIQEVVMAREPLVVCGRKTIGWSNLHWGIWAARRLPSDTEDTTVFSDVFNSVFVAYAFWLDHHLISEWSVAPIQKWLLRGRSPDSAAVRMKFLHFMTSHGWTLACAQMILIFLWIFWRICYGLRPFRSWGLLLPILSAIATVFLTPASVFTSHDEGVRGKIVNLLNRTRTRHATKEVDRVFALYGVFQKFGIPLQKPDYGKSISEVFLEFTRTLIIWHKSLDMLLEASTPALPETPSWVPDWSTRYHHVYKGSKNAARDSLAKYAFSDCGRKLQTYGMLLDTVAYYIKILEEPSNDLSTGRQVSIMPSFFSRHLLNVKFFMVMISYALERSNNSDEIVSGALFETIHSETDFENTDKSKLREEFDKWHAVITADYCQCHPIYSPETACALVISMDESLNHYHRERCQAIANKRKIFVTSKGHIGTGPLSTEIGDRVALLSGLGMPLLLREVGLHHEVVGEAYVNGVMEGELWPTDESDLSQLTLI